MQLECEKKNIADLQNQLESANEKVEKAENDHSETRKKLDDQSMEHKIAAKRQVRMIKDLKSHLKKEAKVKVLRGKIKKYNECSCGASRRNGNCCPCRCEKGTTNATRTAWRR